MAVQSKQDFIIYFDFNVQIYRFTEINCAEEEDSENIDKNIVDKKQSVFIQKSRWVFGE